jgi:hypothetical protein
MEAITREVEAALRAGLYYAAIVMALTLPDICAALESPDGQSTAARYKTWFDAWLAPEYPSLTANDIYSLRCGVVHQGRLGHENMQYARVMFAVPNPRQIVLHNNIFNDVLNLYATTFCRDVNAAVLRWFEAKRDDATVQAHLPRLVQFREQGMPPYIVGIPLIA